MAIFDSLRRALTLAPSVHHLELAVAEATGVLQRAEDRLASLEAARRRPETLAAEGGPAQMRLTLQGARDDVDDARAYLAALGEKHATAAAAETEAARVTRYREAQAAQARAVKGFGGAYSKAAAALIEVIRNTAQVDAAVVAVNADLPVGAEPLQTVEAVVRDRPGKPQHTRPATERLVWAYKGLDQLIPPAAQDRVDDFGDGSGMVEIGRTRHAVERRRIRETVRVDQVLGEGGCRITGLTLPGLRAGDQPFYTPPAFNPLQPGGSPGAVLAMLDALAQPQPARAEPQSPNEWTTYSFVPPEPAAPEAEAA